MPRPGPRLPDGSGSQASSGQLIAYKYCDSRPEAVIKLLGRSGNRSVDRLPRLGQSQFAYGQRGLSQATRTNERAIYLSEALCKSNAGRANLLSQLAGLLRISFRIGVLGRTHPEAVVAVAFHVSISDSSSSLSSSFSYSPSTAASTAPSLHTDLCCDQCLGLAERASGKWRERASASKSRRGRERGSCTFGHSAALLGCLKRRRLVARSCRALLVAVGPSRRSVARAPFQSQQAIGPQKKN